MEFEPQLHGIYPLLVRLCGPAGSDVHRLDWIEEIAFIKPRKVGYRPGEKN